MPLCQAIAVALLGGLLVGAPQGPAPLDTLRELLDLPRDGHFSYELSIDRRAPRNDPQDTQPGTRVAGEEGAVLVVLPADYHCAAVEDWIVRRPGFSFSSRADVVQGEEPFEIEIEQVGDGAETILKRGTTGKSRPYYRRKRTNLPEELQDGMYFAADLARQVSLLLHFAERFGEVQQDAEHRTRFALRRLEQDGTANAHFAKMVARMIQEAAGPSQVMGFQGVEGTFARTDTAWLLQIRWYGGARLHELRQEAEWTFDDKVLRRLLQTHHAQDEADPHETTLLVGGPCKDGAECGAQPQWRPVPGAQVIDERFETPIHYVVREDGTIPGDDELPKQDRR